MYRVMVDDNFDYQEEDARRELGTFATADEAMAACRSLVDRDLAECFRPGMTADELYDHYTSFGEDPFVVTDASEPRCSFSAWNYAKERAKEICSAPDGQVEA